VGRRSRGGVDLLVSAVEVAAAAAAAALSGDRRRSPSAAARGGWASPQMRAAAAGACAVRPRAWLPPRVRARAPDADAGGRGRGRASRAVRFACGAGRENWGWRREGRGGAADSRAGSARGTGRGGGGGGARRACAKASADGRPTLPLARGRLHRGRAADFSRGTSKGRQFPMKTKHDFPNRPGGRGGGYCQARSRRTAQSVQRDVLRMLDRESDGKRWLLRDVGIGGRWGTLCGTIACGLGLSAPLILNVCTREEETVCP
jgi:hypothetical protein